MSDIALCKNNECLIRFSCYRFWAKPDTRWQTYGHFEPFQVKDGPYECTAHMAMTEDELKELVPNYKPTKQKHRRAKK